MDTQEMKVFVEENLAKMNDYTFMDSDFKKIVSTFVDAEMAYINGLVPDDNGECDYDDDAAYEILLDTATEKFPQYKMYFECMVDDYLEVSEKYLSDHGEIEWD